MAEKKKGGSLHPCWVPRVTMMVVWSQVPSLEKVLEFRAHEGEIEDLALGPDGKVRK